MEKRKNIHPGNIVITVIAIMLVIGGGIYYYRYWNFTRLYEQTNDAQVESFINPVSARVGGYIEKVYYSEHQQVNQGDTLVVLDNREYRAQLQAAQAAVEDAYAQLVVLSAGIRSAEAGTRVSADQIKGAEARYWQQQQEIKRYANLVKEEAATGSDFDQVKARNDVAASDYDAAQDNLKVGLARIDEMKSRTALLQADIKKKEASLELAKLNLSYTVIYAPYSGRLGRKSIMEGQQIQPGQPLVSIINEGEKWITANFKEDQVTDMYLGQPVDITIDAWKDRVFTGRIVALAGSTGAKFSLLPPDNSTGNFVKVVQRVPVKIAFDNISDERIVPGMNVTVSVKKKLHE